MSDDQFVATTLYKTLAVAHENPCIPAELLGIRRRAAAQGSAKATPRLRRESIPPRRLMLTVLGGLAEFERELILARTDDGRKRAKARGVKFGR
jgi:hypothetical protein